MAWTPTSTTREDWGTFGLIVGGRDVTRYRGVPTEIQSYSLADPFGEETAQLRFPTVTGFESMPSWLTKFAKVDIYQKLPNGTRGAWLWSGSVASFEFDGRAVEVQCTGAMMGTMALRVHRAPPFRQGFPKDVGLRACRYHLQPGVRNDYRVEPALGIELGITSDHRGSRSETQLDFMRYVLEQTADGSGNQWTFLRDATKRRVYNFVQRDLTTQDWTVTYGAHGVDVQLTRDMSAETNRVYGEGVSERGERWRNLRVPNLKAETAPPYPMDDNSNITVGTAWDDTDNPDSMRVVVNELRTDGHLRRPDALAAIEARTYTQAMADAVEEVKEDAGLTANGTLTPAAWEAIYDSGMDGWNLGGARFDPLWAKPATVKWTYSSNGSPIGTNPAWDPSVQYVERFISYGDGTSRREARRLARREVERLDKATYRGTITLTADPQEGSRLGIQAGDNIRLKQLASNNGVLLHVAGVQVDPMGDTPTVTLTVDNVGRMLPSLIHELNRDRDRRTDPVWAMSKSRTTRTSDALIPWDAEAGSGEIGPLEVEGGRWQVFRFVGAEAGIINRVRIDTDPARRFCFAIFGKNPGQKWLTAKIGNPLDESRDSESPWQDPDLEDALSDREFVEAWGYGGGGADAGNSVLGYGRKSRYKDNGDERTLVGWFADSGQWEYFSNHGLWMWLAVYTSGDTTLEGRLRAQITEGE